MQRRFAYDTSARWDDPFEHPDERRQTPRFHVKMKLILSVESPEHQGVHLVGAGVVKDLSQSGALVITKHVVKQAQRVGVRMPTVYLRDEMLLPEEFTGSAEVQRVQQVNGRVVEVALRFGESLTQNMDFLVFIDSLHAVARLLT